MNVHYAETSPRSISRTLIAVLASALLAVVVLIAANSGTSSQASPTTSTQSTQLSSTGAIDMSSFIGSATPGVGGPIVQGDSGDWAPWGLAISGNGMMAEAGGVGSTRAMYESNILSQLGTISSVSGGSWFNTQFGFSKNYFEHSIGATSNSAGIQNMKAWYEEYQDASAAGLFKYVSTAVSPLWELGIKGMYAWDEESLDKPATPENRNGNTNADLLFCTTFAGDSLLSDNSSEILLQSHGRDMPFSVPAFWTVPTQGSPSWSVPGANPSDPTDLSSLRWQKKNGWAWEHSTDSATILPTPSVYKIGAMSSAANAATANPALTDLVEPQSAYVATFGSYLNPGNGVCTTEGPTCSDYSMMAMDGCFADNLGFALNVGYMQRKYPGKKLRLIAIANNLCDRSTDPTCLQSVEGASFRSFFTDGPYQTVEGWLPVKVPGPNRHIFKESITTTQALGQHTGFGGQSFVTGTFTTVQNDAFGVAAGTTVSLIVLNVNGPLYLQAQTDSEKTGLADVAAFTYKSVQKILDTLQTQGKVASDEAFVYYQSV